MKSAISFYYYCLGIKRLIQLLEEFKVILWMLNLNFKDLHNIEKQLGKLKIDNILFKVKAYFA